MSKKIYNTLKIEGESLCLELVKDNVTKVFENHYEINLKPLFKGKCGIINYELIGNKPTNSAEMPSLKDSFEDFEFEYKNKSTFYEWCSFVKFTDTSVWVEKKWSKDVESSHLDELKYDDDTQILEITFNNGSTYRYKSVPKSVYKELAEEQNILRKIGSGIVKGAKKLFGRQVEEGTYGTRFWELIRRGGYEYEKIN